MYSHVHSLTLYQCHNVQRRALPHSLSVSQRAATCTPSLSISITMCSHEHSLTLYQYHNVQPRALPHSLSVSQCAATCTPSLSILCTYLFIMIRQIVGLHVAYNTILCKLIGKCIIILLAGTWHQICNINNRPVP